MPYTYLDVEDALRAIAKAEGWVTKVTVTYPRYIAYQVYYRVRRNAQTILKVRTGRLLGSIRMEKIAPNAWEVSAGGPEAPYAIYQEFGFIHRNSGKFIRNPFFFPAVEEVANEFGLEVEYGITSQVPLLRAKRMEALFSEYAFKRGSIEFIGVWQ